jgi:hypothetical protein
MPPVKGFVAFEIAGLLKDQTPIGYAGFAEGFSSVPFAGGGEAYFSGAIYGKGVEVPKKLSLNGPMVTVRLKEKSTHNTLGTVWDIPLSQLLTAREGFFGEFRRIPLDLSALAGKQVYLDVEMIGTDKDIVPLIVDDYLILSKPPEPPSASRRDPESENPPLPTSCRLHQNFPNPFNPTTTITFDLPEPAYVSLKIFNALGEELMVLTEGSMNPGRHSIAADFSRFPTGVYLYRLTAGSYVETRRLMLVK